MIWMTITQAVELLDDLEREAKNLEIKAVGSWERSEDAREDSAKEYFIQEARVYEAQACKVKDIRTKVSMFLMAHRYKK